MVGQESLDKIEELLEKYKYNWGRKVDLNCMPFGISQEKLIVVLERIVETGESVLVGWNKCYLTDEQKNKDKERRKKV